MKSLLGIAPQREPDGSYRPSKVALRLSTSKTTDFITPDYDRYQGPRSKILVIATERKNMTMTNGKEFSTGNHPVEALVPMLHLRDAGFDLEIATPTGAPAVFEMWAFPSEDDNVNGIFEQFSADFANPRSLADFVATSLENPERHAAVFVPGGHGAMLGIPDDPNVGTVLRWAHEHGLHTISLCHGPGAFLATALDGQDFLYDGYEMAVFPDSVDRQTPKIGYLPGQMPWALSEKLADIGATVINKKADDTVCLDRRLITGASPQASNQLGQLAAKTLLDHAKVSGQ